MKQGEIDGVPVLWEDAPGPLTASLVFGVGTRHETFRTIGVTHLVEHLVMAAQPKSHLDRNATVRIDTTEFYASGRPDSVTEFLSRICAAIVDLPVDRLATEAGVLAAEGGFVEHPALCAALGARYGLSGPGLAGSEGPGSHTLTEEHVRTHLSRHFVRRNAVLVATGEPPSDLRLHLPDGDRVIPMQAQKSKMVLPARLSWEAPMTSFSMLAGPARSGYGALMRILVDRVTDELRHARGLAYDVDYSGVRLDEKSGLVAIWADGRDDRHATVAEGMWKELQTMVEAGPLPEELAHDRAGLEESLADSRQVVDRLQYNAWRLLSGQELERPDTVRSELAALTSEHLRELAEQALPTVLAHLPEGCAALLDGLPDRTDDVDRDLPVNGRPFGRRLVSTAPLRLQVIAGDDGITLRLHEDISTVMWEQVVGLGIDNDARYVVSADGRTLPVFPGDLRGGADLVEMIDARVPGALWFDAAEPPSG